MAAPADFERHQALVENFQIQAARFDVSGDKRGVEFTLAVGGAFLMIPQEGRVLLLESDNIIDSGGRQPGMDITKGG